MQHSINDVRQVPISAVTTAAARATGTHTVTDGSGTAEADITVGAETAGNTVTVDATLLGGPSVTFTLTAGAPVLPTDVQIGGTTTLTAQALEDAIENVANGLVPTYVATANNAANVVTVVAAAEGRKGNSIGLTETGNTFTLESATLTGGAGSATQGDTATVGTTVFTWRLIPTPGTSTHVLIGDTAEACATNLEAAVEAHATAGAQVTGATVGRVVTWTSILYGTVGHYALAEAGDSTSVSAAAMTGGVNPLVAEPGAGRKIVVVAWLLSLDADGELTWRSASTALMGAMELTGDTPVGMSSTLGALECTANEPLSLLATTAANGYLRYVVVRA